MNSLAKFLIAFALVFAAFDSQGAPKAAPTLTPEKFEAILNEEAPVGEFTAHYPYISPEETKRIQKVIAAQRQPANVDGKVRSQELTLLVDELLLISADAEEKAKKKVLTTEALTEGPNKLDAFLAKLETNYNAYKEPDTRLFASQMIPLRSLRGMVWRMIALFNKYGSKPAHALSLSAFKQMAGTMRIMVPDMSWKLGFDYVTQPYLRDGKVIASFRDEAQLQGYVTGHLYEVLKTAKDRLEDIKVESGTVLWDQRLMFGPNSFKGDVGRFRRIGELEKQTLLADMYFTLSHLAFLRSYDLNGAIALSVELGQVYGLEGFRFGVEGVTAEQQHATIAKYPQLGRGNSARGTKMKESLDHLRNGVLALEQIWQHSKNRGAGTGFWVLDAGIVRLDNDFANTHLTEFKNAVNGPVLVKNDVSGETAKVNIPQFYTPSPPDSMADLLPKAPFDPGLTGQEWIPLTFKSNDGKNLAFRDYMKGSPMSWDHAKFKNVFPDVKSNADLKRHFRVFHSAFASFSSVGPLTALRQ